MAAVTHIKHDSAARIRDVLVNALGTENVPHQWQIFMRAVRRQLPFLSRGRPSQKEVNESVIGVLGFKSWRAMCEAPVENGGLGLNWSKWRQWSRAFAIVENHPGLHDAPLTAAEINRLYSEAQAASESMPADMAAIEAFQERQAEHKKSARAEAQTELKRRVEELENSLSATRKALTHQEGSLMELRQQLSAAQTAAQKEAESRHTVEQELQQALIDLRELQTAHERMEGSKIQSDETNRQLQQQNQELKRALDEYQSRGLLERILAVFSP